jgi:hypothetical protein
MIRGNGRSRSPLASIADDGLAACATTEARLTHYDPVAGEVAAAVNSLCRALIRGAAWNVLANATVGKSGWVDLTEPIIVRAGGAFVAVPEAVT